MNAKIFFLVLVIFQVVVLGGSKSANRISSEDKNIISIHRLQNRLSDQHDLVCNDLDSLFKYTTNITQTGITKATGTITTLGSTTATITNSVDANGLKRLCVTKKISITAVADFDTSAEDQTEQSVCIDSIPAYARLIDCFIVCTDTVMDGGDSIVVTSIDIGTGAGDGDIVVAAEVDNAGDLKAMTGSEIYDISPAIVKTPVFVNVTPGSDWVGIIRGAWDVYIVYNDNASY